MVLWDGWVNIALDMQSRSSLFIPPLGETSCIQFRERLTVSAEATSGMPKMAVPFYIA